ncbi:hypothetical protein D9613_009301 [Agrocybe pediades]|uniref:Transmembrane protein n=1 Tax=Agrocybe pediades TaxID=84607 RepID=A0A8H4R4L9_9AGAR|nr:hypothetical protein D9613_009301 [Agrocybe pediades]
MSDNLAIHITLGLLLAFSRLPTAAAALSWTVCTKDESGKETCKDRVSRGAKISMALACLAVLVLLLTLVVCIVRHRRAAAASEKEYNVEASQVEGPPTIIATEYNPTSGPSGVYSASRSGHVDGRFSPNPAQMSGPMMPATVYHQHWHPHSSNQVQNQTAPVTQSSFPNQPYPFTGYSSENAPKTAFVSGGFPRPLLAGDRLKDRIKERPASVSSLTSVPPAYNK